MRSHTGPAHRVPPKPVPEVHVEILLLKMVAFIVAAVGSFLIATCVFFIAPYAFFGILYILVPEGWWKCRMKDGLRLTWWAHKWLIRLPYTIATIGQSKKK